MRQEQYLSILFGLTRQQIKALAYSKRCAIAYQSLSTPVAFKLTRKHLSILHLTQAMRGTRGIESRNRSLGLALR
jgi:hypothetical protein